MWQLLSTVGSTIAKEAIPPFVARLTRGDQSVQHINAAHCALSEQLDETVDLIKNHLTGNDETQLRTQSRSHLERVSNLLDQRIPPLSLDLIRDLLRDRAFTPLHRQISLWRTLPPEIAGTPVGCDGRISLGVFIFNDAVLQSLQGALSREDFLGNGNAARQLNFVRRYFDRESARIRSEISESIARIRGGDLNAVPSRFARRLTIVIAEHYFIRPLRRKTRKALRNYCFTMICGARAETREYIRWLVRQNLTEGEMVAATFHHTVHAVLRALEDQPRSRVA